MFDRFTYDEYAELLTRIKHERENVCFGELADSSSLDGYSGLFILRHDVDLSIEAALEMARLEAEWGVRATYFLLLSCEHYNLFSEDYSEAPRQLIALGHEVGLHYNVRAMAKRAHEDLLPELEMEAGILSALAKQPVRSIAMHLPSLLGDDPFAEGSSFVNAYDKRFTRDIAYFSDSCGAWRNSAFEAFRTNQIPRRLQLLVHPFFWHQDPGDRSDRLDRWGAELRGRLETGEQRIREVWAGHSGVQEHEGRR
jgi:hypothetical protein